MNLKIVESTTKPNSLYKPGTLLSDLSSVSKDLTNVEVKKLMLEKDKNKVVTKQLGKHFLKILPNTFTSVDITALLSEQQDKIRRGKQYFSLSYSKVTEQDQSANNVMKYLFSRECSN